MSSSNCIRPAEKDYDAILRKKTSSKRGITNLLLLAMCVLVSLLGLNDYAEYLEKRRGLCEQGMSEEAQMLSEERTLVSTVIAFIDEALNGETDPCETNFPDHGLFDEYPPLLRIAGPIPNRPIGTIAYVLTITRCPDQYSPPVDEDPDPGDDIYEVTAVIKDEICNATATIKKLQTIHEGDGSGVSRGQTLYGLVNPNGVTCHKPGSTSTNPEFYDRVSMLQDMGYRVEIVGQPITNDMLEIHHPEINRQIEDDVGIRHTTMLHGLRLVEHPVVVLFNYDRMLRYQITSLVDSLHDSPDEVKGYYVRNAPCDADGNSLIDTGFLLVKPSIEEFDNIIQMYLTTPYDSVLGWNSEGHNYCDGKLGLPGFLSYYFSVTPGYKELDRCMYSFIPDDECIQENVQQDALLALELANLVENGPTTNTTNLSPEATVVNDTMNQTIDELNILPTDEEHPNTTAVISEVSEVMVMDVYVEVMVSVTRIIKRIDSEGNITIEYVMTNEYVTTQDLLRQISGDPSLLDSPELTDSTAVDELIRNAVSSPVVVKQSEDICGNPLDCPPDDPEWTHTQMIACEELHSVYFIDRRRTELSLNTIAITDLVGQFKPRSFHGYCTGPGHENYIGIGTIIEKPEWQTTCEPMTCAYGQYVTPECTCSNADDPCEACPSGTKCQLEPTLMCIDCQCAFCDDTSGACCDSGSDQCVSSNPSPKCSLEANFFAGVSGSTGSVCDASVSSYITGVPNGCGCYPNVSAPCTYDPSLKNAALSCFECTSKDLAAGQCPGCKACLDGHHPCIDTDPTNEVHIESCLSSMEGAHRQNCHEMCNKY